MCLIPLIAAGVGYFAGGAATAGLYATGGALLQGVIGTGMQIAGGLSEADANVKLAERRREVLRMQAGFVLEAGEEAAMNVAREGYVLRGQQVAQAASSGFDLGSTDVQLVLDQTTSMTERAAYLERKNAHADAWALMVSGDEGALSAQYAKRAAKFQAIGTGISAVSQYTMSGIQAAGSFGLGPLAKKG